MTNYQHLYPKPARFKTATGAAQYFGIGRSTFYRWRADPNFPKPVRLFGAVERYDILDLDLYIATKKISQGLAVENAKLTTYAAMEMPAIPARATAKSGFFPPMPR